MNTTLINIDPDNNTRKFYSVTVVGRFVHLHWGRIGTAGQKQTRSFSFESTARQFAREKIDAKLDRGYERMVA